MDTCPHKHPPCDDCLYDALATLVHPFHAVGTALTLAGGYERLSMSIGGMGAAIGRGEYLNSIRLKGGAQ